MCKKDLTQRKTAPSYGISRQWYLILFKYTYPLDIKVVVTGAESNCFIVFKQNVRVGLDLMNRSTPCQTCYCCNHLTSNCHHWKQDTHFFKTINQNYMTHFEIEGDRYTQKLYHAAHYLPPPRITPGPPTTNNNQKNNKRRNT